MISGHTCRCASTYFVIIASSVSRYNIHGKKLLETDDKFYFGDVGIRNFIVGSNLTNAVYFSHLSRLKYIGVYNMGRNVTFKLVVPF